MLLVGAQEELGELVKEMFADSFVQPPESDELVEEDEVGA